MRAASFLLLAFSLSRCGTEPPPERPNVIVILTDDQGWGDVGVHGNPEIRTPTLDRFAQEGVELTRFYVEPVCAPTRASLLTGRSFYRTGVIHTSRGGAKMHGDEVTIAEMLRCEGYRTGHFGKWHLGDNYPMRPIDQGFEEAVWHKSGGIGQAPDKPNDYFDPILWKNGQQTRGRGYCTDLFFDAAIDFIDDDRSEPFFAYIATNAPHTPLIVGEEYSKPYLEMGLDSETAKVYGMIENIDQNLRRLLLALETRGLRDNTLIVFLSDNGPQQERFNAELRGRKASVYEGGVRALSFWQWPGRWTNADRIDRVAAHIDLAPTILEAVGAAPPADADLDGRSLLSLLDGRAREWPERTIFLQVHRGLTPKRFQNAAAVQERYKLVFAPNAFRDTDWQGGDETPGELYDLENDPGERNDLAAELPLVRDELRRAYESWFADVRSARQFEPGVIVLGHEADNPTVLCRYQDATYVDGRPKSWAVEFAEAGDYEFRVRGGDEGPSTLYIERDGERFSAPLDRAEDPAVFSLASGPAELDVWVQAKGRKRNILSDNSAVGDVTVRRLP